MGSVSGNGPKVWVRQDISKRYLTSQPSVVVADDFLSQAALDGLRRLLSAPLPAAPLRSPSLPRIVAAAGCAPAGLATVFLGTAAASLTD